MLNKRYISSSLVILFLAFTTPVFGDESALLEKSREITVEYATELQANLAQAMAAGGPVHAISVCKNIARQLASELSLASGATVRRTSVRFRNPDNAPDAWETRALAKLESSGATEIFEPDAPGGARYLKAIPTGAVCIACHGDTLAPEIEEQLDKKYPDDRARGFSVGDLRGAFSIAWPARASGNSE